MGNSPSSNRGDGDGTSTTPTTTTAHHPDSSATTSPQSPILTAVISNSRREPRRRESLQALSGGGTAVGKATPAPPSIESATALAHGLSHAPSSSFTDSLAQGIGGTAGISRVISSGSPAVTSLEHVPHIKTPQLRPLDSTASSATTPPRFSVDMGNQQSSTATDQQPQPQQLPQRPKEERKKSTQSPLQAIKQPTPLAAITSPVAVPHHSASVHHHHLDVADGDAKKNKDGGEGPPTSRRFTPSPIDPQLSSTTSGDAYHLPPSDYTRPPRLPLPIEEELHTPGSPIISPADIAAATVGGRSPAGAKRGAPQSIDVARLESLDEDSDLVLENEALARKTSVLTSGTMDEDGDEEDDDDATVNARLGPSIPTVIEWRGGGEKVYVTGTFAQWDRKYRLHKNGPSKHKDALSATLHFPPGTHHIKFIVDGDMCLSDDLPTAVDFTNILVNYVEVAPDSSSSSTTGAPHPTTSATQSGASPLDIPSSAAPTKQPTTTNALPLTADPVPSSTKSTTTSSSTGDNNDASAQDNTRSLSPTEHPQHHPPPIIQPIRHYHRLIPSFLSDLDNDESTSRYRRATALLDSHPLPPSLPGMLAKSILNGTTPVKDDSSVLNMPNHTVLNHLATSSIKHNVLATSATTRYRKKYVTTIMYKPTSETD